MSEKLYRKLFVKTVSNYGYQILNHNKISKSILSKIGIA